MANKTKVKSENKIAGKIEVEVQELDQKAMFMTQHFGNGSFGDTKFDASFTLPAMGLIVSVNGKRYKISSQNLIEEIIKLHEKDGK